MCVLLVNRKVSFFPGLIGKLVFFEWNRVLYSTETRSKEYNKYHVKNPTVHSGMRPEMTLP